MRYGTMIFSERGQKKPFGQLGVILQKLSVDWATGATKQQQNSSRIITVRTRITGEVAQWLERRNSNLKTLDSIPSRGRVTVSFSFSAPPSQLLCRLVCA